MSVPSAFTAVAVRAGRKAAPFAALGQSAKVFEERVLGPAKRALYFTTHQWVVTGVADHHLAVGADRGRATLLRPGKKSECFENGARAARAGHAGSTGPSRASEACCATGRRSSASCAAGAALTSSAGLSAGPVHGTCAA